MGKELIDSFNENNFSELSEVSKVHPKIAYKYAGNEINTMVDHFMNTAVYYCVIEQS